MSGNSPGETAGFIVMWSDSFGNWFEANADVMDTIGQAANLVRRLQDDYPKTTYAVGKVTLSMISRPENPTQTTEALANAGASVIEGETP